MLQNVAARALGFEFTTMACILLTPFAATCVSTTAQASQPEEAHRQRNRNGVTAFRLRLRRLAR